MITMTSYTGTAMRNVDLVFMKFPGGERHVSIKEANVLFCTEYLKISFQFSGSDDIVDLLLLVDAVRRVAANVPLRLDIPYIPFGRQDRAANVGEPHSLKVLANLINSMGFDSVNTVDPHSDVTEACFDRLSILKQHEALLATLTANKSWIINDDLVLVSPDGGSLKKIWYCSKELGEQTKSRLPLKVIRADKSRDTITGEITGTVITNPELISDNNTGYLIVDDICDGGRTFIELAKEIRKYDNKAHIMLYVTHGIFSKGTFVIFEHINQIFCYNDMNDLL